MNFLITAQRETSKRLLELLPKERHKNFLISPSFKLISIQNKKNLDLDDFDFVIFSSRFAIDTFTLKHKKLKNKILIFLSKNLKEHFYSLPIQKDNVSFFYSLNHSQKGIIQLIKRKNLSGSFLFPCSQKADFALNQYFQDNQNNKFFRYECYSPQAITIPAQKQSFQAIIFLSQSAFDAFYLKKKDKFFNDKTIICFSKELKQSIQQTLKHPPFILYPTHTSLNSLANLLMNLLDKKEIH